MARSSTTFKKGAKAGPGRTKGKLNRVTLDIREAAQKFGQEAIATLVDLMRNADFETVRVAAAKELLDRAYGKSMQPVQAEVAERIKYDVVLSFDDAPQHVHKTDDVPRLPNGAERQH